MKCFECIFRDCTQNTGLTPEESKAIFTWLPEEAKSKKRRVKMAREKVEICGNCKYHQHEDITDGWVCVNDESEHLSDWTEYGDTCEEWEER
jgi:hypothetical protein